MADWITPDLDSIVEGTKKCLERLQMDYVDVIFAHRADPTIPMEEVVRAFNWVIEKGWVRVSLMLCMNLV